MAARSGTTGTGSRVPRPGSRCSTHSEGTQSLWKHNQFLERRGETRKTCRCDSCCISWGWCHSHCAAGLYPALPHCWWKLSSTTHKHRPATISGTQGWVSGYGLLTLRGGLKESTQFNTNPAISSFCRGKSRLCLFAAPSHFLGTYVGSLTLATLSLKPTFLAAAQLDSTCTTQLSTGWAQSMWGKKKRHFLNELKRNQCESRVFCLNFTVQRKHGICGSYGYLDQSLLTQFASYEPQAK